MREAQRACASGDVGAALDTLTHLVDDFRPSETARSQAAAQISTQVEQVSAA